MRSKKNFLKDPKRKIRSSKLKFYIFVFVLVLSPGCFLKNGHGINDPLNVTDLDADRMINVISGRISDAEKKLREGKLIAARQNCDLALGKLLSMKEALNSKEYEQLHGRIAL
ncbi:MAG: hypothetical protein PF545_00340, partial [Elusimicrobia bacterium]|nr:hypothetical protein [Elusimicrobiota bacterium]